MGFMGKCLKNIFSSQKFPGNPSFIFSRLKFHSVSRSPTTKFHSISGSPTTALESSWGVRPSRSLTKGFTSQTEEHWGSLHKLRSTTLRYTLYCTLYTVHCTLYTVHCILYTVNCTIFPPNFFRQFSTKIVRSIFHLNFSTQFFHPFLSHNLSKQFVNSIFSLHFFT